MELISIALLLSVAACGLLYYRQKQRQRAQNIPPLGFGLLSVLYLLKNRKRFNRSSESVHELGDIYRVNFGITSYVLNSYRAVYEAFVEQGDVFSGRQRGIFIEALGGDHGVASTDGPLWQEHRRFMLRLLRDFGLGKSTVTDLVQDEIKSMIESLNSRNGHPVTTVEIFASTTNNVIARLLFGERIGTEDEDFKEFLNHFKELFQFRLMDIIPLTLPFILKIPGMKGRFKIFKENQFVVNYISEKIRNHRLNFRVEDIDQATCLCDAFLIEQARQESLSPGDHTFTDAQLSRNMVDLFIAGTDTTATALTWATLLLSIHQDIQRRVIDEINTAIGRERSPTLADRQSVPYVCAVLDEVLRFSSFLPNNLIHRTTAATKVLGFDIPANMLIQTNIQGIHRDPRHWSKPNEFYPEHFLNDEGSYQSSKFLIPFSIGKRACLGESLARTEYFIGLVAMMQNFELRLEASDEDLENIFEGSWGIVCRPRAHKIIFTPIDR